jgi:hypothetical protein
MNSKMNTLGDMAYLYVVGLGCLSGKGMVYI